MKLKLGAMALVVIAGLYAWLQYTNAQLIQERLDQANAAQLATETTLKRLQENYSANAQALNSLQHELQSAQQNLLQRSAEWEALKREHDDLKEWAETMLPAAARELHQRPAITGARGYRDWVSNGDTVQPATQQPENQPRPEPRHPQH